MLKRKNDNPKDKRARRSRRIRWILLFALLITIPLAIYTNFFQPLLPLPDLLVLNRDYSTCLLPSIPNIQQTPQPPTINRNFGVYVVNTGNTTATNFEVRMELIDIVSTLEGQGNIYTHHIDSLDPHQTETFAWSLSINSSRGLPIQYRITVDPDNQVGELYEFNNTVEGQYYVFSVCPT